LDIHAPHRPIGSVREALVHLALITGGVLIALSFEGVATWREHRALVREARTNLTSEIRDNTRELRERLQNVPQHRKQLEHAGDMARLVIEHKKIEHGSVELGFSSAELRDASRTTAEVTGAFALMEYEEVKKYASVYNHQALYLRFHNDVVQGVTRLLGGAGMFADADRYTVREIEDWQTQLRTVVAALFVEEQIGQSLLKEYEDLLKGGQQ